MFDKCLVKILARSYSSRFNEYKQAKFTVIDSKKKGGKFLVSSTITLPGKKDIDIVWYLESISGKLMITDVKIQGISMKKTQKQDICGRIKMIGVDKFLVELQSKYAS